MSDSHTTSSSARSTGAELARSEFAPALLRTAIMVFDETVLLLSRRDWAGAIATVTRDLERIMPEMIARLNMQPVGDRWKMPFSGHMDPWMLITEFNKKVVGQMRTLLAKSRRQRETAGAYADILTPDEVRLVPLAAIDGILLTLHAYRGLAAQSHVRFCSEAAARHVLETWLALQRALSDSRLFA